MTDETRDPLAKMSDRLVEFLSDERLGEGMGYSRQQCEALALQMARLDFGGAAASTQQRADLLSSLLSAQPALAPAEVLATAGVLPKLQLGRLLIGAGLAAELLGIHQTTLLRRRWDGDIQAALIDQGAHRIGVYYALADILYVLAYQQEFPYPGGAVKAWPELT